MGLHLFHKGYPLIQFPEEAGCSLGWMGRAWWDCGPGLLSTGKPVLFWGGMFWLGCLFFHFLKQKGYFCVIALTETTPQKNGFCRAEDAVFRSPCPLGVPHRTTLLRVHRIIQSEHVCRLPGPVSLAQGLLLFAEL